MNTPEKNNTLNEREEPAMSDAPETVSEATDNEQPALSPEEPNALESDEAVKPEAESDVEETEDETLSTLIAELKQAKQAADEAGDQALRAQAELQNFRRRKERESSERIAQANARLILEMLPVVDDFTRAFDNIPESIGEEEGDWVDGFRLILRKLETVLEREGVTAIDATGEFDPNIHEAISMEPNDGVESGHVIAEVQRGYMLKEKVLRPSYVRVAQ
ncbi:MAG: nucleotide exchange factor GrpE [Chloroflexi bacterium]|nr:nucleotide exchange factor GrpE [Chloroflexota bacterium]